ncbi:MAG: hypothetical protein K2X39_06115, partial [Silvanigrellaceae bacterium]|nr:hypothetical protein [Silvanigrellaceae bacterium]
NTAFYFSDIVNSQQLLTYGFKSDWSILRKEFKQSIQPTPRFSSNLTTQIGSSNNLANIAKELKTNIPDELNNENIYEFSSHPEAYKLFEKWAQEELIEYSKYVEETEFYQNNFWMPQAPFSENVLWELKPFGFSVESSYNFIAQRTANEMNTKMGPGVAPLLAQPMGDVITTFYWNAHPLLPLGGTFATTYSQSYKRINGLNLTLQASFVPKLTIAYGNGYSVVQDPANSNNFLQRRTISGDLNYQPLDWLKFRLQ